MNQAAVGQATDQPFVFQPAVQAGEPSHAARGPQGAPTSHPTATSPPTESLVTEARREIAEIVREVAQAVHEDHTEGEFLALLADRTLRAMAAEGVIVWKRVEVPADSSESPHAAFDVVARLGNVTDVSTPLLTQPSHQSLLGVITDDQQPVVVPATPGASDPEVAANPASVPAAVVPIHSDPTATDWNYVLEAFLEPECGIATQRGYLRFVSQMADLAGEFLRVNNYRQLKRCQDFHQVVNEAIEHLHRVDGRKELEASIVDSIAELFGVDRVGLCYHEVSRSTLAAVSHVETIDLRSPAAEQIRNAAESLLDGQNTLHVEPTQSELTSTDGERMVVRAVVSPEMESTIRIVLLSDMESDCDIDRFRGELQRFARHAGLAIDRLTRSARTPGFRLFANRIPERTTSRLCVAGATLLLLLVVFFPLPMVVVAPATIRPAEVQNVSSPRNALVQQIHVEHGQRVGEGDKLLTLIDSDLEQQVVSLVGKRAVLEQQQAKWTSAIVTAESRYGENGEQPQSEQRLVAEEIRAIDEQLSLLRRVEESLVVRADRSGVVDAWRLEDRLARRPVRRGEHLLRVVAEGSPWLVDANVSQKRIEHVERALDHELVATVSLTSRPNDVEAASLVRIGPSVTNVTDGIPTTVVVLKMSHDALDAETTFRDWNVQSGAPAQVRFRCGTAPAIYLLFQDVIRSVRGTIGLYATGSVLGDHA